jgi:hypothetical protein
MSKAAATDINPRACIANASALCGRDGTRGPVAKDNVAQLVIGFASRSGNPMLKIDSATDALSELSLGDAVTTVPSQF